LAAGTLPQIAVAGLALLAGRRAVARLRAGRGGAPHRLRVDLRRLQWAAVLAQAIAVQAFGWLAVLRDLLGDLPGLDEVLALLPAIGAIGTCWWAAHPMEKLLRPALAGRRRYVVGELRNQLGILGVPALVAIATMETSELLAARMLAEDSSLLLLVLPTTMLVVLVLAPITMVSVLDTAPLGEGPRRTLVDRVLRDNGIALRRVLVWRTGGSLLNGAVVGVLHPWRYLLLTDAVLDLMPGESLRAIVAHEVGHLRRRHLPWLVVVGAGILAVAILSAEFAAAGLASLAAPDPDDPLLRAVAGGEVAPPPSDPWLEVVLPAAVAVMVAIPGFGWVSRRFERQADTFAVQYLSATAATEEEVEDPRRLPVRSSAVLAMCRALGRVAELNGIDAAAPSWRHGSIQSRQRHLVSLVGQPIRELRIDRQIRAIKLAGVVLVSAAIGFEVLRSGVVPGIVELPTPSGIAGESGGSAGSARAARPNGIAGADAARR